MPGGGDVGVVGHIYRAAKHTLEDVGLAPWQLMPPRSEDYHSAGPGASLWQHLWSAGTQAVSEGLPAATWAMEPAAPIIRVRPVPEPTPASQRLADFRAQKVTPSVPAIGQGRNVALAQNIGRLAPFSPVNRGIVRNLEETQAAAERAASGYGTGITGGPGELEYGAGATAQNEMKRFVEVTHPAESKKDFDAFYRTMQGAPPAPMTNTLNVLSTLRGKYPNAPELQGLFSSPKLSRVWEALEPRQIQIPAKTSPVVGSTGQPIVTSPAQTIQRGGVLSMPEIRDLRSKFGEMLANPTFGPDSIPIGEIKRLYGGLTGDMMAAARTQGPNAVATLQKAIARYGVRMRVIDRLKGLADPMTSAVSTFNAINRMAQVGTGGDPIRLRAVKDVMSKDSWDDFAASILRKMGRPLPGEPHIEGVPDFSVAQFGTNWHKLSEPAKELLFGPDKPGSPRAGVEQLVRVTDAMKAVARLNNPSHSGEYVLMGAALEAFLSGGVPWRVVGMGSGAWGIAKALMSPKIATMLYEMPALARSVGTPEAARALGLAMTHAALAHEEKKIGKATHMETPAVGIAPMIRPTMQLGAQP